MDQGKSLIPNSTQIPNILLDFVIPKISEAEGKCLLYICRRTYGFHKERDRISLSQFVDGIKNRDDKILDYGAGVSRPAVVEALKNLVGSGLVDVIKTNGGNYYEINLGKLVDNEVVKKVNQLRKLTKTSKESLPKQVKLLNPQKKGNKGNKEYSSSKLKPYFRGDEMRFSKNKWWVLPSDGSEWLEFVGLKKEIEWK